MEKYSEKCKKNLFENSIEKENYDIAVNEWYFNHEVIDNNEKENNFKSSCELCEHEDLRWQFIIINKYTSISLRVGSTCIKQFDIVLIEKSGYRSTGEERNRKIDKSIYDKHKEAIFNNVLEALRTLWRKDKEKRTIIEEAAKQWKGKNAFSPNMLFFLIHRFETNKINYNQLKFKISIRSEKHKNQFEEFTEQKYLKIRSYLSDNQRNRYDSLFGVWK